MLEHLGEPGAAVRLEKAVADVIREGKHVTYDMKPSRDDPTAVGHERGRRRDHREAGGNVDERWRYHDSGHGRKKVTVIGAGNVGTTAAQEIARRDYADVVLVDIIENLPQGKALDLNQAGARPRLRADDRRHERLRGDGRLRRDRRHRPASRARRA